MEQPASNPTFCTNNCGFYGSSQFEGMCSKCYREHVNRTYNAGRTNSFTSYYSSSNSPVTSQNLLQEQVIEDKPDSIGNDNSDVQSRQEIDTSPLSRIQTLSTISADNNVTITNDSTTQENISEEILQVNTANTEKKKRNRCSWQTCNKKLGLTSFDCRCGGQFCSLHRYANEHNCTFDYKEHGQNEIRKNMPVVQAERVQRI